MLTSKKRLNLIFWVDVKNVNRRIGIHYIKEMGFRSRHRPIPFLFSAKPQNFKKTCPHNFIQISHILTNLKGLNIDRKTKIKLWGILGIKRGTGLNKFWQCQDILENIFWRNFMYDLYSLINIYGIKLVIRLHTLKALFILKLNSIWIRRGYNSISPILILWHRNIKRMLYTKFSWNRSSRARYMWFHLKVCCATPIVQFWPRSL